MWAYIIGSYRLLCACMLPLLAIVGSALAFYRVGYHTTLTPMLIDVTLHTNMEEAMGVVSWQAIAWVAANIGIAGLLIWIRWTKISLRHEWAHLVGMLLIILFFYFGNDRLHCSLRRRFPFNVPYTIYFYRSLQQSIHAERQIPSWQPVAVPDSLTMVLILGEAVRADHLQLNGYDRQTTPRLCQRNNLVSYTDIFTDQTHTIASLPYILTRADSIHEQYKYTETSFTTIFRKAGFKTAWLSNQDMSSSFTAFISECDTVVFPNPGKTVSVFTKWLDEDLIPVFYELRQSYAPRALYIFHPIGSHWYYDSHVPESMYYYQPVTTNRVVTANSLESIINSYDNTVRYMDFFVDSIISSLEEENALVIYQSDHGEALGEDGMFLHANDADAAMHPACVIWYSDRFAANNPDMIKALLENKDRHYRTDYVFYSILHAAGIHAEGSSADMNIFMNPAITE